jgi:hypothetical protein
MIRWIFTRALFSVLSIALFTSLASPQATVDPQSLVGTWSGNWVASHGEKNSGQYVLTIERVDGEKVIGKGEITGRRSSEFKVNGTLSGNQLSYGRTTLTVDGERMSGTGNNSKITLTKQK